MDMEIVIATNASAYDQTPVAQQINLFDAAKVMMTLKKARYTEEVVAKQPSPVETETGLTDRPVRKGSAKKGWSRFLPGRFVYSLDDKVKA